MKDSNFTSGRKNKEAEMRETPVDRSQSTTNGSIKPIRAENELRTSNARWQCGQKYFENTTTGLVETTSNC